MASKRRGKGEGRGRSSAATVSPNAVIAATRGSTTTKAPRRKKKPDESDTTPKAGPRRPARRIRRGRGTKPEVVAGAVTHSGGKPVKVDPTARRRAKRLVAEIRKRKRRVTRDFYAMGEALVELSDPRLHSALGYPSFNELLADQKLVSRSTAFKLMAVVESYSRQQALELGLEKAYGLIQWSKATDSKKSPSEMLEANVLIGDERVRDITVRALAERAKRARESARPTDGRIASRTQAERIARRMQRELRAQGLASAQTRARRAGGQWQVQVEVMADDAAAWLEAV